MNARPTLDLDENERFRRQNRSLLRLVGIVVVVLMASAVALWAKYGGTVFFDMMATAWSYCF